MELVATVVLLMSSVFLFVYFQTEPWAIVTILVKILLMLACGTFLIQFIGKRIKIAISKYRSTASQSEQDQKDHKKEHEAFTEKIQRDFQTQAENYKEKILNPREEAKKKQKEEEFYRFLGPAWKGKGESLGVSSLLSRKKMRNVTDFLDQHGKETLGGEVREADNEVRFRRLEENINEEFREQVQQEQQREAQRKQRKKIILPDEPDQGNPDSLQIMLRSPLGQIHTRRFLYSNTLQVILDYITTLGFNQKRYTLATTYPRQLLTEQRELTLQQLEFTRRTTLNIEEIEML